MKPLLYLILTLFFLSQCRPKEEHVRSAFVGKPMVPSSIKKEHETLLNLLQKILLFQDSTGHTAVKLSELMQHHFKEEEDYVLPPLGLLPMLASGQIPFQSNEVIVLTEELKSQLPHLSAEHQMIKAMLDELLLAAAYNNHPEVPAFAEAVGKHATEEEEVFFPASILVGDYLKLKSLPGQPPASKP